MKQLLNQWLNLDLVLSEGKLALGLNLELELQLGLCIDLNMVSRINSLINRLYPSLCYYHLCSM